MAVPGSGAVRRRRTSNIGTPQSAVDGIAFGTWKDLWPRSTDCDLAQRAARGREHRLLLAQRLPKRSPEPPRKPANRWLVIGYIEIG